MSIDTDSLLSFKERVHKRYPKQDFLKMTNQQFLTEIGAAYEDRDSGEWKLKKGTVLFLGKTNSMPYSFSHYFSTCFSYGVAATSQVAMMKQQNSIWIGTKIKTPSNLYICDRTSRYVIL